MKQKRISKWWYDVRYNLAVKVNAFNERQTEKMRARLYPANTIPGRDLINFIMALIVRPPHGSLKTFQMNMRRRI